jgi:hypothetical protein
MKIALSDILPNPYRVFNLNPINERKIEKLMESIEETGLWKTIVRRSPTVKGKYELAFGHHRFEAAKRKGLKEADYDVQNLSNEQMIMMLARDNDEVYNASMLSIVETVAATVQGLADGSLKPLEIDPKTNDAVIRYAPSYIPGEASGSQHDPHVPYTPVAIGKLLGYTKKRDNHRERQSDAVDAALDILYLVQIGQIKLEQIAGLTSARQITDITRPLINRLNTQRKIEAERAKNEAQRLKVEQEQKALREEQEAIAAAAKEKKQAAERKKREAEEAENATAVAEAEAKRKKAVDDEALRILKAHTTAASKALLKYGAPSVNEGAAIEKTVQKAKEALEAKDVKSAEKLTEQLSKLSRSVTDKYLAEQKVAEAAANQARKELPTRSAVKTLNQKFERIMSDEDPLRESVKTLSANKHVTFKERQMLYLAMKSAADRLEKWAEKFAETGMVDVLAEAEKNSKKAPPAFEQDNTAKAERIQAVLDEAAEKRRTEREQENAELEKSTTKRRKKK